MYIIMMAQCIEEKSKLHISCVLISDIQSVGRVMGPGLSLGKYEGIRIFPGAYCKATSNLQNAK